MISIEVVGIESTTAKLRAMVDPKTHTKIMRSSVRKGMTYMAKRVRGIIPAATTEGHDTASIKRSIGSSLKKNAVSTRTEAKLGVNVGAKSLESIGRRAWRTRKAMHGKVQVPHSHLYVMGTADRWTGSKMSGRGQSIKTTATGKVYVKRKGWSEGTGKARRFRGRMMGSDVVSSGVMRSAAFGVEIMRSSIELEMHKIWTGNMRNTFSEGLGI